MDKPKNPEELIGREVRYTPDREPEHQAWKNRINVIGTICSVGITDYGITDSCVGVRFGCELLCYPRWEDLTRVVRDANGVEVEVDDTVVDISHPNREYVVRYFGEHPGVGYVPWVQSAHGPHDAYFRPYNIMVTKKANGEPVKAAGASRWDNKELFGVVRHLKFNQEFRDQKENKMRMIPKQLTKGMDEKRVAALEAFTAEDGKLVWNDPIFQEALFEYLLTQQWFTDAAIAVKKSHEEECECEDD